MEALGSSVPTTRENASIFVVDSLIAAWYTDNMDGAVATF
jgi:hypothetical protein